MLKQMLLTAGTLLAVALTPSCIGTVQEDKPAPAAEKEKQKTGRRFP